MKIFKIIKNIFKNQRGYSLAELSISMAIIAMLAVGGLSIMGKKNAADRVKETEYKLSKIETVLEGFIRQNRYVPCPSGPRLPESNTNFGQSVAYNTTDNVCDNDAADDGTGDTDIDNDADTDADDILVNGTGAVPVRALGLSDDFAYDGWGHKFTYRTADSSGISEDFDLRSFSGDLAIMDRKGVHKTDINQLPPNNNGAIYVVISHGSNGAEVAYRRNDTTVPASVATGTEGVNTNHSIKTYVQAPKSETFDDIVIYGMKKKIIPPVNIAAPIQFDKLTCENAHAVVKAGRSDLDAYATAEGSTTNADLIYKNALKISYLCENEPTNLITPSTVSNLALWLDADDEVTLFTGSDCSTGPEPADLAAVGCWKDKSGNGYDAVQTTGDKQPLYRTSIANGKPVLRLDGTNDDMVSSVDINYTVRPDITVITTYQMRSGGASNQSLWGHDNGSWDRFSFLKGTGSLHPGLSTGSTLSETMNDLAVEDTWQVFVAELSNGTASGSNAWVNGTKQLVSNFTESHSNAGNTSLSIGSIGSGSYYSATDISEMLIYERILSNKERAGLEFYLADKWGVSLSSSETNLCPTGMTFTRDDDHPEGSCQCPDGQVLYQELVQNSACYYGSGFVFNKCVSTTTGSSPVYANSPDVTNMTMWLDANDCSTITLAGTAGLVSTWADKSPSSNDAAQAGADSLKPTYKKNEINSMAAISFDGGDYLTGATPALLGIQSSDYEMYIVGKTGSTNTQFLVAGASENFEVSLNGSAGARFSPVAGSSYYTDIGANSEYDNDIPFIINATVKNGTSYIGFDGITSPDTAASATSANATALTIGARNDLSSDLNGEIAEIIIYGDSHTNTEREAIEEYLGDKWGIFLDPNHHHNSIGNTLLAWYDARDISTIYTSNTCSGSSAADDGTIGCWGDKAGSYNLTQSTASAQPLYQLGRINGHPAIDFDGVNDVLYNTSEPSIGSATSTVFSVLQNADAVPSTYQVAYELKELSGSSSFGFENNIVGGFTIEVGNIRGETMSANVPHIYASQFTEADTSAFKMWIDGVEPGSYETGTPSLDNTMTEVGMYVGSKSTSESPSDTDIGELVAYSGTLDDVDRKAVERYLGDKWDITVTP